MERFEVVFDFEKLEGAKRDRAYQRRGWYDCLTLFKQDDPAYSKIQTMIKLKEGI